MQQMARKQFSEEMVKKINWVRKMYSQWQLERNELQVHDIITYDLDDDELLLKKHLYMACVDSLLKLRRSMGNSFLPKHYIR